MSDVSDDPTDRAALLDDAPHPADELPEQHTLCEHAAEATAFLAADDDKIPDAAAAPAQRQVTAAVLHTGRKDDNEDQDPAVCVSLLGNECEPEDQETDEPLAAKGDSPGGRVVAPAITAVAVRAPMAQQPDAAAAGAAACDAPPAAEPRLPLEDGAPALAPEQHAPMPYTDPASAVAAPKIDAESDPEARTALLAGNTDPDHDAGVAEPEADISSVSAAPEARMGVAVDATAGTSDPSGAADSTADRLPAGAGQDGDQLMPAAAASPAEGPPNAAEGCTVAEDAGTDGALTALVAAAAAAAAVPSPVASSAEAEPPTADRVSPEARDNDHLPMPPAVVSLTDEAPHAASPAAEQHEAVVCGASGESSPQPSVKVPEGAAASPAEEAPDAALPADGQPEAAGHGPSEEHSQQPVTTDEGAAEAEVDAGTSHDPVVGERSSGLNSHPLQLADESAAAAATEQADTADARIAAGAMTPPSAGDDHVAAESEPQTPGTPDAAAPTTPTAASAAAAMSPAPALPSKPTPQPATLAHAASAPVPALEAPGQHPLMQPMKASPVVHPDVYFATTRAALVSHSKQWGAHLVLSNKSAPADNAGRCR